MFNPTLHGRLQRKCACGNHTIGGVECAECGKRSRSGPQTKRKVNEAGDSYEQEAARIADRMIAGPGHHPFTGAPPRIQCHSGKSDGHLHTAPASVDQALSGPGRPLDPASRQDMELRFGYDFSGVRVHTDAKAAESALAVNALAYTAGKHVVFGAGQYTPFTEPGRRLLSHELAHIVQQGGTALQQGGPLFVAAADDIFEHQAKAAAASSSNGILSLASGTQSANSVHRAVDEAGAQTGVGAKQTEGECEGWFSDRESTTKRAAEYYVRTELLGDRGRVEKIECDLFNPDTGAYACTAHFTDGTPIRVIVRRDAIIVGVYPLQSMYPPPDRPLCWYDYTCSGPNRDLVLTKRKCQTSKPAAGAPPAKAHGPEP